MSEAREVIFDRIRAGLGRGPLTAAQRQAIEAHEQTALAAAVRPRIDSALDRRFIDKLTAVAGTVARVPGADKVFTAIAAHLDKQGLARQLVAAPALQSLDWPADWKVRFGATRGEDLVAVTPCFVAVAETGSVVLLSGAEQPTSLNFLPDYHIVLVKASQLVQHIEDVWPPFRALETVPRSVNFITGPSKTADVEQTIQLGAHGPRSLHVILIDNC
ncbi:MAG: LUD domain-containing protein [Gammaproteobacteria bacterium]|nr:LUD domain-containing protein [Gammaproteobacteria bacterium]